MAYMVGLDGYIGRLPRIARDYRSWKETFHPKHTLSKVYVYLSVSRIIDVSFLTKYLKKWESELDFYKEKVITFNNFDNTYS